MSKLLPVRVRLALALPTTAPAARGILLMDCAPGVSIAQRTLCDKVQN